MAWWRKVAQFVFDKDKLPRQLSQLEDGVHDALDAIAAKFLPVFSVVPMSGAIHVAHLWQLVQLTGPGSVQLPIATALNAGVGMVILNRKSASGTVSVFAVKQNVNGLASDTLPAAVGAWIYISVGDSWARIGRA